MASYVEYEIDIGQSEPRIIRFELDAEGGMIPASAGMLDGVLKGSREKLHESIGMITATAKLVKQQIDLDLVNVTEKPDISEFSFSIKFAGEANAVIAKSSAEAQMHVKFVWTTAKDLS